MRGNGPGAGGGGGLQQLRPREEQPRLNGRNKTMLIVNNEDD